MKLHYEDVDFEVDLSSGRHVIADHPQDAEKIPFTFRAHGMLSRESLESTPRIIHRIFPLSILGKALQDSEHDPFVSYDDAERALLNCAASQATSAQIKETMEALLVFYEDAKADEAENDALNEKAERVRSHAYQED